MKSVLQWGVLSLIVYIIFLLIKLPAVQVLSHFKLPAEVQISGVSGTVWQGSAKKALIKGSPIENVSWSLSFFSLLVGNLNLDVKAGNARDSDLISLDGNIILSKGRIQASELQAYFPTDMVIASLPLPVPVKAGGRFKVQINNIDYTNNCQSLSGKGQWLNAKFTGPTQNINLGNFDANLTCENGNVLMSIQEPNSFGLTAVATISPSMEYSIEGRFKPADSLPEEVHQAVKFFPGQADAEGYYPLSF